MHNASKETNGRIHSNLQENKRKQNEISSYTKMWMNLIYFLALINAFVCTLSQKI